MAQSESIKNLAAAMCEFQYHLEGARKDSKNPFFKSTYADLESCLEAIKEPLHKYGLAIVQTCGVTSTGAASLTTTLMHSSGEWISGELPLTPVKNDPQAQGSAITYARRYALCAITGLVQVDDDGNHAVTQKKTATASSGKENAGIFPWEKQREAVYRKGQESLIAQYESAGADMKAAGWTAKEIFDGLQKEFLTDDRSGDDLGAGFRDAIRDRD